MERADADGSHDERDDAVEGRTTRVIDVGGSLDIRATGGDGLVTAELLEIHRRFVDIEFRKDIDESRSAWGDDADAHPLPRTDRQRRFDALVAIFRAAGDVGDIGSATEALVNIVVDADTWGRMIFAAGFSTSTDLDGRPIPSPGSPSTSPESSFFPSAPDRPTSTRLPYPRPIATPTPLPMSHASRRSHAAGSML